MRNNVFITGSIVLFKESLTDLHKTIDSFMQIESSKKLFLIDNTPNKFFQYVFVHEHIEYIPVEENIGFGAAHNKIIPKIENYATYHLILNPDVFFKKGVIENLILQLEKDKTVGMIAPKVLFPSGKHQYSCRRYPSILELIIRRFSFLKPIFRKVIFNGEYRMNDLSKPFFADYLTGCFQLYKTADFVKVNGFDERYFLYMEDVDICKKIDAIGKRKLYYPETEIVHVLKQGSSKNLKLFFFHISSAIKYFLKWGI